MKEMDLKCEHAEKEGGIIQFTSESRHVGVVVGVGAGVNGLAFGDQVEVRCDGGIWFPDFFRSTCSDFGLVSGWFASLDGRQLVECDGEFMIGLPEMIIYRMNND